MNAEAIAKTSTATSTNSIDQNVGRQTHEAMFSKVLGGRKQPVRGLWERSGRFYAQLTVENPITAEKKVRRVPLADKDAVPMPTAAQAIGELKRLQTQRADNDMPSVGRTPKFGDYAARYLDFISSGQRTKKAVTVDKERTVLAKWTEHLGGLRLDQIKRLHLSPAPPPGV